MWGMGGVRDEGEGGGGEVLEMKVRVGEGRC